MHVLNETTLHLLYEEAGYDWAYAYLQGAFKAAQHIRKLMKPGTDTEELDDFEITVLKQIKYLNEIHNNCKSLSKTLDIIN